LRKKTGLVKKDKINLVIVGDSELVLILDEQKEFIKGRTNAREIEILNKEKTLKNFSKEEFRVKRKEIKIFLKK